MHQWLSGFSADQIIFNTGTPGYGYIKPKGFPQWFGAKGDWDGTTGTDDTVAVQLTIDTFPVVDGNGASFLVTAEIQAKSWASTLSTTFRNLRLHGKHTGRSVLSLAGCTFSNLDKSVVIEGNTTTTPKTLLLLGRTSAGSAGWHNIIGPKFLGSASLAGIYSVASETNTIERIFMSIDTKYGFYTSQGDDLVVGGLTGSSNYTLYFSKNHIEIRSFDSESAVICTSIGQSTGLHSYRDSYLAAGNGAYIKNRIWTTGVGVNLPGGMVYENIGGESSAGYTAVDGILFDCAAISGGYSVNNLKFRNVGLSGSTNTHRTIINAGNINSIAFNDGYFENGDKPSILPVLYCSEIHMLNLGNMTISGGGGNHVVTVSNGAVYYNLSPGLDVVQDLNTKPLNIGLGSYTTTAKVIRFNNQRVCWHTGVPTLVMYAGNYNCWKQGDIIYNSSAASGQPAGWMCVTTGTFGTAATTGSITSGTALLTVASATGFTIEDYITIAGVTGTFNILNISGLVFTLDSNANATVSGAAVATPDPVFAALANLP
jgi:hypothetical protein